VIWCTSALVAGPMPKAVITGCPSKKLAHPESTTKKCGMPAAAAKSLALRIWSRFLALRQTLVPGDAGSSAWYVFCLSGEVVTNAPKYA